MILRYLGKQTTSLSARWSRDDEDRLSLWRELGKRGKEEYEGFGGCSGLGEKRRRKRLGCMFRTKGQGGEVAMGRPEEGLTFLVSPPCSFRCYFSCSLRSRAKMSGRSVIKLLGGGDLFFYISL